MFNCFCSLTLYLSEHTVPPKYKQLILRPQFAPHREEFRLLKTFQCNLFINVHGSQCKVSVFCPILTKKKSKKSLDFNKNWKNLKFHENPSCGSDCAPCRQWDSQDEENSSFSLLFYERWKHACLCKVTHLHYKTELEPAVEMQCYVRRKRSVYLVINTTGWLQ